MVNLLDGARVYLSGPMDFVGSRAHEAKYGWRSRIGMFLRELSVTVFDPWHKPGIRGMHDYGREGVNTSKVRDAWDFGRSAEAHRTRARLVAKYWQTLHIDLRMVDAADFLVAYCPTNIYSVGTPHEIALARLEHKPVLFVSPPVTFPSLAPLQASLKGKSKVLLKSFLQESGSRDNPGGIPSLWYMPLIGMNNFFDGFGFYKYQKYFRSGKWKKGILDEMEEMRKPKRPLLPFIEKELSQRIPKKWLPGHRKPVFDDDWLLGLGARRGTTR